jgi:hypothetical protein
LTGVETCFDLHDRRLGHSPFMGFRKKHFGGNEWLISEACSRI